MTPSEKVLHDAAKRTIKRDDIGDLSGAIPLTFSARKAFECGKHGEYQGRSSTHPKTGAVVPPLCRKCEKDAAARVVYKIQQEREAAKLDQMFGSAGIPKKFQASTFGSYDAKTTAQSKAKDLCFRFLNACLYKPTRWLPLSLLGSRGTGKTHLMCAVASGMIADGRSVIYQTTWEIVDAIFSSFDRDSKTSKADVIHTLGNVDLLILDEVGAQTDKPQVVEVLNAVIDKRYREDKPILLGGNVDEDGLSRHLGDRSLSRLHEGGAFLVMDWEDHRSTKGGS